METFFHLNLKHLREGRGLSINEVANSNGFGRSQWNNYELGTSFPKFLDLIKIAKYFDTTESDLIHKDLSETHLKPKNDVEKGNKKGTPNYTPIGTPKGVGKAINSGLGGYYKPNVYDFETPAAAGPAIALLEKDKYREEPTLYMPWLGPGIHVRTPVSGDSMHSTIKDGDKVVSTLVTDAWDIRQGYIYMFLDVEDGICYKRLYRDGKSQFELVSDNEVYKPYKRHFDGLRAIFRVREVHSTDLRPYWNDLRAEIRAIHSKMADFERMIKSK